MTAKHAAQHSKKKAPAQPSIDASRGLMQSESACVPANSQVESHAGIYLQRAHMTAFGRFIDRTLGPFKPGLNVVYGPNEAGKTTARAFVGGVLFGWPEARGSRNAYKPRAASREGSLLFCDAATGEVGRVSRARNAEGLIGDDAWLAAVRGGIDRETFQTLFSLDADELRSLEAAPDISAKLLTAGSGTKESPAHVVSALDARIAALMSRAASETESFPNLKRELEGVKERLLETRAQADELKAEDIELRSLLDDRERLQRELSTLDSKIEAMAACKGELSRIDSARHRLREEMASAQSELRTCEADARAELAAYAATPYVSAEDEARLRASLELLSEQEDAAAQRLSAAREAYEQARGFWEARRDAATQAEKAPEARASRTAPIAAFCAAGLLAVAAFALALAVPDALPVAIFARRNQRRLLQMSMSIRPAPLWSRTNRRMTRVRARSWSWPIGCARRSCSSDFLLMSLRPARRCVSLASCMMLAKPSFVPTGRVAKRKQGSTMQAKNSQGAKRIAASALNPLALPAIRHSAMLRRRRLSLRKSAPTLTSDLKA